MDAILHLLFNPLPNAIMTVLTGISLVYWLFTMLIGDGFDFGDADADIDFDGADVHEVDSPDDPDMQRDGETTLLSKAMNFINIGKAPFMVIVTLFKFIGWLITIASSIALNLAQFGWKSVLILIPIFILTYMLMHYVTIPVAKLYKKVGYAGEEPHDFLGRSGTMRTSVAEDRIGSVEIIIAGDVIRLPVKSHNGDQIAYGEQVVITGETADRKIYYVKKEINLHSI
ncbi:OB-fold-containig protein [Sphingobacterium griseoflavum]|uniref:DUF1449 family protein n=1 Tax=Sphingobacterium griseoflavum TaxID=1474952 RepID=A0ABQ3HWC6_9SPHI|nr:OB-fold-containig protein [Sphingobacterium griseoflavum]GHE41083.1 hypothetical protein GCM10017764_25460 [Sphingobacterium griseoflavum]